MKFTVSKSLPTDKFIQDVTTGLKRLGYETGETFVADFISDMEARKLKNLKPQKDSYWNGWFVCELMLTARYGNNASMQFICSETDDAYTFASQEDIPVKYTVAGRGDAVKIPETVPETKNTAAGAASDYMFSCKSASDAGYIRMPGHSDESFRFQKPDGRIYEVTVKETDTSF
jgi:hypothetical protein